MSKQWRSCKPAGETAGMWSQRLECDTTPMTYDQARTLFELLDYKHASFVRCVIGPRGGWRNPQFNNQSTWPESWAPPSKVKRSPYVFFQVTEKNSGKEENPPVWPTQKPHDPYQNVAQQLNNWIQNVPVSWNEVGSISPEAIDFLAKRAEPWRK